ncbi:MAG TPA: hypothetical protein VGR25_11585 [bacterium]|jgi:hypothetical protein|nr:hypothetical protein [bacterium]
MYETLKARTREALGRHLGNERGQGVVTWLIILAILWLLLSSARLTLQ